jgi:hypothetical protein
MNDGIPSEQHAIWLYDVIGGTLTRVNSGTTSMTNSAYASVDGKSRNVMFHS